MTTPKRITKTVLNTVTALYGEDSLEVEALYLLTENKVPVACIAEIFGAPLVAVESGLFGGELLPEHTRKSVVNCINTIVPMAVEKGLLPCKDISVITGILSTMVEIVALERQIKSLQD